MKPTAFYSLARQYKVTCLREQPAAVTLCETPNQVYEYHRNHIATDPYYNPDVESCHIILLNTRRRIIGHTLASQGIVDTILVHAREVFRTAIVAAATQIILTHNHPSGDPTPSSADLAVTGEIVRAGQILKIEVLDHVITSDRPLPDHKPFFSIRQSGLVSF